MEVLGMPPHHLGQPSFYYYNPDPNTDHGQHGHFSQHPSAGHEDAQQQTFPQQYYHPGMMMTSQPPMMYHQMPIPSPPMHQRPVLASPQPILQKAVVLSGSEMTGLSLNTECGSSGSSLYPATPELSESGSAGSSPPSTCGILPTPMTLYGNSPIIEGVKEGCEGDVKNEILAGGDFTRACSPPLTPVFIHPPAVTASQATDLLSINSCPSLSPSPSPGPQSAFSDTEINFCDPRNLLKISPQNSQPAPDNFPVLPTLCSGDDEEHKLTLGGDFNFAKPDSQFFKEFDTSSATLTGLQNFDSFSDLDSENEFVTDLTRFAPPNAFYPGNKKQQLELVPFDDESLLSEDSFEEFEDTEQPASAGYLTPPESHCSESHCCEDEPAPKMRPAKKARSSPKKSPKRAIAKAEPTDSESNGTQSQAANASEQTTDTKESTQASGSASVDENTGNSNTVLTTPSGQPIARRGRKQSLTDDPSKTFVCTLCSRRFRRQEHLKRHYRSLHTHDKPFKCGECGKQFSRSDNLSQHSRTHGSGAITLDVLEEGELPNGTSIGHADALGARLFEAAAAVSSGESSHSESRRNSASPAPSIENTKAVKKRKRDE